MRFLRWSELGLKFVRHIGPAPGWCVTFNMFDVKSNQDEALASLVRNKVREICAIGSLARQLVYVCDIVGTSR
jgi:hypothetical protein